MEKHIVEQIRKQVGNNFVLYLASLGIMGFIPLIVDKHLTNANLISAIVGIVWIIIFLVVFVIRWKMYFKFVKSYKYWVTVEKFTSYYRIKDKHHKDVIIKLHSLPIELITSKDIIFKSNTDIIKIVPESIEYLEYVDVKQ